LRQLHRTSAGKPADPQLRALQVLHHRDGATYLVRSLAYRGTAGGVVLVHTMGKVQAYDVDAGCDEVALEPVGGWTESGHQLGAAWRPFSCHGHQA
jgi:hypothetical protein